jgi:hypothetical protein
MRELLTHFALRLSIKMIISGFGAIGGYYIFSEVYFGNYLIGKQVIETSGFLGLVSVSIVLTTIFISLVAEATEALITDLLKSF